MAKITLYGFYKWMKNAGDDLFANLNVPAGLDKNTLIDNIIIRGGEYEVLYADPYFMQDAIRVWSDKWQSTFTRWVDAMAEEYDPLYNYDRYEEWTDTDTGTVKNTGTTKNTGTVKNAGTVKSESLARDTGTVTDESDSTTTNTKAAYNSSNFQNDEKVDVDGKNTRTDKLSHNVDATDTTNLTRTDALNEARNDTRTDNLTHKHDAHIYGNIGVTTSSAMLAEYMDTQAKYQLVDQITDMFLREFVIPVL